MSQIRTRHRPQTGFMLLEVLISTVIFCVGVLALVGLQVSMTRSQTDSKVRADASYLANELVGLIWSDVSNMGNYDSSACASYAQCNAWKIKVQRVLPSSTPTVSVTTTAGTTQGRVVISISWTAPNGDAHKFTTETMVQKSGDT